MGWFTGRWEIVIAPCLMVSHGVTFSGLGCYHKGQKKGQNGPLRKGSREWIKGSRRRKAQRKAKWFRMAWNFPDLAASIKEKKDKMAHSKKITREWIEGSRRSRAQRKEEGVFYTFHMLNLLSGCVSRERGSEILGFRVSLVSLWTYFWLRGCGLISDSLVPILPAYRWSSSVFAASKLCIRHL